ncbi:MAG: AraC family transcriptional regulator [Verrucomicrobiales bacterium]|nr:AraC family transcriptional regulator [Verrucomicrobiales bacterium]
MNRSPVWALDVEPFVKRILRHQITVDPGQVICLLQRKGSSSFVQRGQSICELSGEGVLLIPVIDSVGQFEFASDPPVVDCVMIGFQRQLIEETLQNSREDLNESVRISIFEAKTTVKPEPQKMPSLIRERSIKDLRNPPVNGSATHFWYESRVREVISLCFFGGRSDDSLFCSQHNHLTDVRIRRTKQFIKDHLDQPFDLHAAAEFVGCSPHYLSRTFSESEGTTISQYQRHARIARAAELLLTGKYNINEAALEVGYNSPSHFSKAFRQEKGMLPSQFLDIKNNSSLH